MLTISPPPDLNPFDQYYFSIFTKYEIYNTGGTPISLGEIAEIVKEFIPDAEITFDNEGGIEHSDTYLVDNSRLLTEFEIEYAPYRDRVFQMINEVRQHRNMPLINPSIL